MKLIRWLAGIFILISGILHVYLYLKTQGDPGSIGVLVVGFIYCITGSLLFNRRKYPLYLGIAVPLIGMTLSFIKFGVPEIFSLSALFKLLGASAVVCCSIVLFKKTKYTTPEKGAGKMKTTLIVFLLVVQSVIVHAQVQPVSANFNNNGNKLNAKFWQAGKGISSPTVILLHGFPGNASSPYGLAEKLNSLGMNVLSFNYEGSFNSGGVFSWENCMADVGAAISFLKQKKTIEQFAIDTSKITVCGCSLGAAFALSSAVHNPEIHNVIAVVGGNDLSIYLQRMKHDPAYRDVFIKRIAKSGASGIRGDSAYIHQYFDQIIPEYEYFDLVKNGDKLKNRQIFFIAAWLDTLVPMEEFILPTYRHLRKLNPEGVSIKAIETDHSFTNARDELSATITAWIKSK